MTDERLDELLEKHANLAPASTDVERAMIVARLRIDRAGYFADEDMQKRFREIVAAGA